MLSRPILAEFDRKQAAGTGMETRAPAIEVLSPRLEGKTDKAVPISEPANGIHESVMQQGPERLLLSTTAARYW
jgi:hypothetical protein